MKKLFINIALYSLVPQLPRVLSFFLLPLYTQYLTPSDYGIAGIIFSVTGLFMGVGDLGLHVRQANSFFKSKKGWLDTWRRIYTLLHIWGAFLSIIQSIVLFFILPDSVLAWEKWTIAIIYFVTNAFLTTTINFCTRYYQYIEKPRAIVTISALVSSLSLVFNFVFIVFLKLGFMAWVFTHLVSTVLNFVLSYYFFNVKLRFKLLFDFTKRWLKANFAVSLPLVPHNYASYLLDASDRLMMKFLGVTTARIGEYNFAYIFGSYFDFFVTAISLAIAPGFARDYFRSKEGRDKLLFSKIMTVQLLLVAIAMIGTIWLREVFTFIIADDNPLRFTYHIAIIIMWAYAFRPIYWLVNCILTYNNATGTLWKITFTAGVGSVLINLAMIPWLGVEGAAWTTLISMIIMSVSGLFFKSFVKNFSIPMTMFAVISVIVGILLVLFSLWMVEQTLLLKMIVSAVLMIVCGIAIWINWSRINLIFTPKAG